MKSDLKSAGMSLPLEKNEIRRLITSFLKEDVGCGDVTTNAIVPGKLRATGQFIAKQNCVLAGLDLAREVFRVRGGSIRWKSFYRDGQEVSQGDTIARIAGDVRTLLTAERVALNVLQRMSGVATLTHMYAEAVRGTNVKILDTRKTMPGWRRLEKYAVRCGGGHNHRMGLYDAVLIKDNHIAVAGGVTGAIERARRNSRRNLPMEVEICTMRQLCEALALRVDRILLDNMSPKQVRQCVHLIRRHPQGKKVIIECSGRISLKTVRAYAATGVDWISVGALTHSAMAVDISFEISAK